jgi:hypothetical protein
MKRQFNLMIVHSKKGKISSVGDKLIMLSIEANRFTQKNNYK